MIDPGFLLLAAILVGTPIAIVLWGIWYNRWIDRAMDLAMETFLPHEHGLPASIMEELDAAYLLEVKD